MSKPMPEGWNKTCADLFQEMEQGTRLIALEEEIEWALAYERSLLPASTIFPQDGQLWEAVDDCAIDFEVFFAAPGGGPTGTVRLARGERIRVGSHTNSEALIVHFLPLRYDELRDAIVPSHVRDNPRYSDYALSAPTGYFNQHFKLVKDVV